MKRAAREIAKRVKIWVPAANDEARTIHIEYSVENAPRFIDSEDSDFEPGHDELYWNVTGDEWGIPILAATARVQMPSEVMGLAGLVYTGPFGSSITSKATATEIELIFYLLLEYQKEYYHMYYKTQPYQTFSPLILNIPL